MTQTFADLLPTVDVDQASRHLILLHSGAKGYLSLVLLGAGHQERHGFVSVSDLGKFAEDESESVAALQEVVDQRWNVYTGMASQKQIPEHGRGARSNIETIPGVWADIDVKPGVQGTFQTPDEARHYIGRLLRPTMVINSGSGGLHAYWLVHPHLRLDMKEGEELLSMWRDYLLSEAKGMSIDNVQDSTRILRLAGTVRWPKENENCMPRLVTIAYDDGPRYHTGELMAMSAPAHQAALQLRKTQQDRYDKWHSSHRVWVANNKLPLEKYDKMVRIFNNDQDWAVLLERTGWTLCADQRGTLNSCRYWTRPGKSASDGKSASTDWVDTNGVLHNVMTIYSRDPDLEDIFETQTERGQIICTKWHYALTRIFQGDERALLASVDAVNGVLVDDKPMT